MPKIRIYIGEAQSLLTRVQRTSVYRTIENSKKRLNLFRNIFNNLRMCPWNTLAVTSVKMTDPVI